MSVAERPYLSIGEVLGLLLEEFPDVTISKIRFLESQGLIDPERTPSGYRKFYEADVERLKVILREQRENFLPLKVIRDRLERGAIDETGQTAAPRGVRNVAGAETGEQTSEQTGEQAKERAGEPAGDPEVEQAPGTIPTAATPASPPSPASGETGPPSPPARAGEPVAAALTAAELCARAGITDLQLADLLSFGLVHKPSGPVDEYGAEDVAVAVAAGGFLRQGVEARHLRGWKLAAEREAGLFEQMIMPLLRQRNPQARQQAVTNLRELSALGAQLRDALLRAELGVHLDS
jgi:DNA-binding transcriptional MerR regulator